MINRGHYHYLISFLRKAVDHKSQAANNTGSESQHLFTNRPTMALLHPVNNRLRPFFASKCISEYFMLQAFFQSLYDKRSCAEIHISYPHWNQVIASPTILYCIPFYGICTMTVYYFIKIIVHTA